LCDVLIFSPSNPTLILTGIWKTFGVEGTNVLPLRRRIKKEGRRKSGGEEENENKREYEEDSNSGTQLHCYCSSSQIMIGIWRRITFQAAS
jgi:hypothetical protein